MKRIITMHFMRGSKQFKMGENSVSGRERQPGLFFRGVLEASGDSVREWRTDLERREFSSRLEETVSQIQLEEITVIAHHHRFRVEENNIKTQSLAKARFFEGLLYFSLSHCTSALELQDLIGVSLGKMEENKERKIYQKRNSNLLLKEESSGELRRITSKGHQQNESIHIN